MKCNRSGKFAWCDTCFHATEHEEVVGKCHPEIACKELCCYDGKKFYKVFCVEGKNDNK